MEPIERCVGDLTTSPPQIECDLNPNVNNMLEQQTEESTATKQQQQQRYQKQSHTTN